MFTYEERKKAVELLIKYDLSYASVIRELGYPSRGALRNWYYEYKINKDLHCSYNKKDKYTTEEKIRAVNYYIEHGKCVSRTVRKLGYPSRPMLDKWILEIAPDEKNHCRSGGSHVHYSQEEKENAVISLKTRCKPAREVAENYGTTRSNLYVWERQLTHKEPEEQTMDIKKCDSINTKKKKTNLNKKQKTLTQQVEDLQAEVKRLKIERDIYEKAIEIIKKDKGIDIKDLTNREKAIIINALRKTYKLKELLEVFKMAKSSYFYQIHAMETDKYSELRIQIKLIFNESTETYGYRRIHLSLKAMKQIVSEKVVRRIMKEENLIVPFVKRKKFNSYKGEISPAVENLVNRDFHADKINSKWLTDITEFHIPAGKVYLSPIIDCFDGLPVSWTIGTSPNADLVNTMLDNAIETLQPNQKPIVHSDRGCHYRWPGWIKRMDNANLTRSMSKKGYSPDNSACEGFFGRLKNEMFYNRSWQGISIECFIDKLNVYIKWYGEKRIKVSLGGMSPLDYRKSLGLVI